MTNPTTLFRSRLSGIGNNQKPTAESVQDTIINPLLAFSYTINKLSNTDSNKQAFEVLSALITKITHTVVPESNSPSFK